MKGLKKRGGKTAGKDQRAKKQQTQEEIKR
jgi:hypothetical protein